MASNIYIAQLFVCHRQLFSKISLIVIVYGTELCEHGINKQALNVQRPEVKKVLKFWQSTAACTVCAELRKLLLQLKIDERIMGFCANLVD